METLVRPDVRTKRNGHVGRPPTRAPWFVLSAAFVYAVLRYVVFGETELAQIPLYVTNKALAAGSAVCLLMAGYTCVRRLKQASRSWGRWALHTAGLHAVTSTALLAGDYYPAFFGDVLLSFGGELSLLAAVLALYCFATIGKLPEAMQHRRALAACGLVAVHVLLFGYPGWLDVPAWHGGLPPISLLTFAVALAAAGTYAAAVYRRA